MLNHLKLTVSLLFVLLLIVACGSTPASDSDTEVAAVDIPAPGSRTTPAPTPTAGAPAADATTNDAAATETVTGVLGAAFDDRSVYLDGLVSTEQGAATAFPAASVYQMQLSLDDTFTELSGIEDIQYTNQETIPLSEVVFRLFPNLAGGETVINSVTVNGESAEPTFELRDSVMRVPLATAIEPGQSIVMSIDFDITIPTEGGGNYGTYVFDQDILAAAHFFPMIAVYDDEGWNIEIAPESGDVVYADSAFFLVELTAPRDLVLAASGRTVESKVANGRQVNLYAAGPVRDFYFVGSERFTTVTAQVGETTINSYAFGEHLPGNEYVLEVAALSVQAFNERIGQYPFTELDLASTPTGALGVEYPGIVVNSLRMYNLETSPFPRVILESTVAHEVAHQWFYSTIGNDQLDEPWLDESMTQYATMLYFEFTGGTSGADEFRDSLTRRWSSVDSEAIAINQPVAAYTPREYGAIIYGRGPLFVAELANELGESTFETFIRRYYEENKFGIVTTEGFKALVEDVCDCDVNPLFDNWIYVMK